MDALETPNGANVMTETPDYRPVLREPAPSSDDLEAFTRPRFSSRMERVFLQYAAVALAFALLCRAYRRVVR